MLGQGGEGRKASWNVCYGICCRTAIIGGRCERADGRQNIYKWLMADEMAWLPQQRFPQ